MVKVKEGLSPLKSTIDKLINILDREYPQLDYTEFIYKGYDIKSNMKCRLHNETIEVRPRDILKGRSLCPSCKKEPKSTKYNGVTVNKRDKQRGMSLSEFISKASKRHGDGKFDFSKTKMGSNQRSPIDIICKVHGEFSTTSNNFLGSTHGCPKCALEVRTSIRTYTNNDFIREATKTHGTIYDYSNVNYVNAHTKVSIICSRHGTFLQKAGQHIHGYGCPKCSSSGTKTLDYYIEKAREIHGDEYDYSEAIHKGVDAKTNIICPEHGMWHPTWSNHINKKSGCPVCADIIKDSKYLDKETCFYYLKVKGFYKIGITTKYIKDRYVPKELTEEEWQDVDILFVEVFDTGGKAFLLERTLANKYNIFKVDKDVPKLFKKTGNTEVFEEDILGLDSKVSDRQEFFFTLIGEVNKSKELYLKEGINLDI